MINSPSFAHTNATMNTFSMKCHNDPRMIYWHVDRYARNIRWSADKFYSRIAGRSIWQLVQSNTFLFDYWGAEDTFVFGSPDDHKKNGYLGFVQSNCYSLSRKWFTDLHGDEWVRFNTRPKQTICPNLSLTRYDWRPNGLRKFNKWNKTWYYTDKIPDPWRIPELFSIDRNKWESGYYEPNITRTYTKLTERYHGPSWEIKNRDAGFR